MNTDGAPVLKTCVECGVEFVRRANPQKVCGEKCRHERRTRQHRTARLSPWRLEAERRLEADPQRRAAKRARQKLYRLTTKGKDAERRSLKKYKNSVSGKAARNKWQRDRKREQRQTEFARQLATFIREHQ